jgi:glycosidase
MDAAPYWFKKPGTDFESLKETHALQALFKSFIRHVVPQRGITFPEVGATASEAAKYFGAPLELAGSKTTTEGDGLFAFEMQAALREMIFTGSQSVFWRAYQSLPEIPEEATWLNMLGHHDEIRTDLMSDGARERIRTMLIGKGALDFAGRGLGGRTAPLLDNDPTRISNAFFALYMTPGTPIIYYGDEIGVEHDPAFMKVEQHRRHRILNELGVRASLEQAQDTRDLARKPTPAERFDEARRNRYQAIETIRALSALRDLEPALKGRVATPIRSDRDDVLSIVRSAEGAPSVLAMSNLTSETKVVRIPRADLEAAIGRDTVSAGAALDLLATELSGAARRQAISADGDHVSIELAPYAHVILGAERDRVTGA